MPRVIILDIVCYGSIISCRYSEDDILILYSTIRNEEIEN